MEKKIILVTGSNRGIGLQVVREYLSLGHRVILTSRDEEAGTKAAGELSGDIHYHRLDVTVPSHIERIQKFVADKFGRLDILVNNAGINYDSWHHASDADLDNVHHTLETNLFGPWRMSQAFVPMMKEQQFGRIVNVSSGSGAISGMTGGTPGYSISKTALNVLTIKLAAELREYNILVNSVCPGWVRTDMGGQAAPRSISKGAETIVWAGLFSNDGPSGKFFRDKKQIPF